MWCQDARSRLRSPECASRAAAAGVIKMQPITCFLSRLRASRERFVLPCRENRRLRSRSSVWRECGRIADPVHPAGQVAFLIPVGIVRNDDVTRIWWSMLTDPLSRNYTEYMATDVNNRYYPEFSWIIQQPSAKRSRVNAHGHCWFMISKRGFTTQNVSPPFYAIAAVTVF